MCNAAPGSPVTETCDGLDNDCDGAADDGFNVGQACTSGTGACLAAGIVTCDGAGGATCNAVPGTPSAETCDGADNDCDGSVDNAAVPASFMTDIEVYNLSGVTHVTWSPVPGATGYDVVKGSLVNLRSSAGNFQASTNACVANDTPQTDVTYPFGPAPGFGFYFLVRPLNCGGNGTFNSGDQTGLRDSEVIASGFGCQ